MVLDMACELATGSYKKNDYDSHRTIIKSIQNRTY